MDNYKSRAFRRNYGFWNEEEQKCLINAHVAIAGVGGDGFQLGYKLAMMGVQNFSIADPEVFEEENSNRVFGAKTSTYGRRKVDVFREMVLDIRPKAKIRVFKEGVNELNVREFMKGADIVLDESELTRLEVGTMIARTAREYGIPNVLVMNIGFSAIVTSFRPKHGKTFEDIMGIPRDLPLKEVAKMEVDFSRCLPYLSNYCDLDSLRAVQEGASLPSISQGVDIASALGTTEVFLHLVSSVKNNRRSPTWAPYFRYMDSYNGKSGIAISSTHIHNLRLAKMSIRSNLGLTPRASYSKAARKLREKK